MSNSFLGLNSKYLGEYWLNKNFCRNVRKNVFLIIIFWCVVTSTIVFRVNSYQSNNYFQNCSAQTSAKEIIIMDQNDAGSGGDAGNTFINATDITFGTFFCNLPDGDKDDFYKFFLSSDTEVFISIAGEAGTNLDLHIYDATEKLLISRTSSDSQEAFSMMLTSSWFVIHVEKIIGPSIYYLILKNLGSNPISNPTTPTDDIWYRTSPGNISIEELIIWIIPGILVIAIIGSIFAFIRARNKLE